MKILEKFMHFLPQTTKNQLIMFIEALMVFKSYAPLKLEKGMLFLISEGRDFQIRQLDFIPQDQDEYLKINGYPVEPYIIDAGNINLKEEVILATPEQIGWFDEGEWSDELCDIEIKHFNRILEGYDGWVTIEMMEAENEDELTPVIYNNKVTIGYADLEDEYDDDDDDDDDKEDPEEKYWRDVRTSSERNSNTEEDLW